MMSDKRWKIEWGSKYTDKHRDLERRCMEYVSFLAHNAQCSNCKGTDLEPLPWSEIFEVGK